MNSVKQSLYFHEMTQAVGRLIVGERFAAGEPESGTVGLLSAELCGGESQELSQCWPWKVPSKPA